MLFTSRLCCLCRYTVPPLILPAKRLFFFITLRCIWRCQETHRSDTDQRPHCNNITKASQLLNGRQGYIPPHAKIFTSCGRNVFELDLGCQVERSSWEWTCLAFSVFLMGQCDGSFLSEKKKSRFSISCSEFPNFPYLTWPFLRTF